MVNTATRGEKIFYSINNVSLVLLAFLCVYPFLHIIATSFSSTRAIVSGEVGMLPVDFNTTAYRNLIEDGQIFRAFRNTVVVTAAGVSLNMVATIMAAYPLSKQRLTGRNFYIWFVLFTMLFNGGLIPTYLVVRALGLIDSYWSVWFLGLVSTFNLFVMKTFFQGIPQSLEDSASIDGANDIVILIRIFLPLSVPVIATLVLFYAVGHWNSYMNVLIFIPSPERQTLMVVLQRMILSVQAQLMESQAGAGAEGMLELQERLAAEAIRAAAIVIATTPIMLIYPFLQKYFVKGALIGSVKG
ncbi:MAG: carbohydrate ABC transporter permease [Spirochaetaceae bacterium]|nr:MAG: carbohydrate ABC transporter permease [Spirochaetaceae bacterium]